MTTPAPSSTIGADTIGFCSACGIIRQDTAEGVNVTDCKCTALLRHAATCGYVASVSCPIDVGMPCKAHDRNICEECECNCGALERKT